MRANRSWSLLSLLLGMALMASGCSDDDGGMCIAEGSSVLTPQGATSVEDLRRGDLVMSVDPVTGELLAAEILHIRTGREPTVRIADDAGRALRLTPSHPVLTRPGGPYLRFEEFMHASAPTVTVLMRPGELGVVPISWRPTARTERVFDLTVDSSHHNFVAEGFVVHNKTLPEQLPGAIDDLVVASVSNTSVTLEWTVPEDTTRFTISVDGVDSAEMDAPAEGQPASYTAENLSPDTEYELGVLPYRNFVGGHPALITARTAAP